MSDAINHPLPPELGEPPIDVAVFLAQAELPTTRMPTTTAAPEPGLIDAAPL